MDGDIFGAVGRLGRDAAEALAIALRTGEPLDPFLPARCLERMFHLAGGIPSLPDVLDQFRSLREAPLLAPVLRDTALEGVERVVRAANGTVLDLTLRAVADRRLLAGQSDEMGLVEDLLIEMLDRAVITGRGGLVELEGGGPASRRDARRLLRPLARDVAQQLVRRPDAKRLAITKKIEAHTNLLGGGDEDQP